MADSDDHPFTQDVEWPENGAQFTITIYQPTAREVNTLNQLLTEWNFDNTDANFDVRVEVKDQVAAIQTKGYEEITQSEAQKFMNEVRERLVDEEALIRLGASRFQPSENWPVVYSLTLTN